MEWEELWESGLAFSGLAALILPFLAAADLIMLELVEDFVLLGWDELGLELGQWLAELAAAMVELVAVEMGSGLLDWGSFDTWAAVLVAGCRS